MVRELPLWWLQRAHIFLKCPAAARCVNEETRVSPHPYRDVTFYYYPGACKPAPRQKPQGHALNVLPPDTQKKRLVIDNKRIWLSISGCDIGYQI